MTEELKQALRTIEHLRASPLMANHRAGLDAAHQLLSPLSQRPAAQAAHEPVGEAVAWRYKIPTHGGGTAWTHTRPQPECLIEAQPLYTHPAPGVPEGWTDEQCLKFMCVALRHVEYKRGTKGPSCDDIRLGLKFALAAAQAKGGGHA